MGFWKKIMEKSFLSSCIFSKKLTPTFFRLAYWSNETCSTNIMRHSVCVFGVEHLDELSRTVYLFANKMVPQEDWGAVLCWHEMMRTRTHKERGIERLKSEVYLGLPQVGILDFFELKKS